MTSDAIWYAKRGNVRPLSAILFGAPLVGTAIGVVRDYLFRKEKEDKNLWGKTFEGLNEMGSLGIAGRVYEDIKYQNDVMTVPSISMVMSMRQDIWRAIDDEMEGNVDEAAWRSYVNRTPILKLLDARFEGPAYRNRRENR